jgi:GT2 family glycosyltransferase
MKICLIIINYNGYNFFIKYLDKIIEQCIKNNIKLIISDDNSDDNSINYLTNRNITFTQNNGPRHGFAANVNNGILFAKSLDNFDYYIISNNDIECASMFFDILYKTIGHINENFLNVGLIGFKEINQGDKIHFEKYNFEGYDYNNITQAKEIPGFFFLIKNDLIKSIGLFNEEYFMYGEDNDYFHRAIKAGYKLVNTNIPIMHYSEGSSSNSKRTSWYVYRNSFLFAQLNLNLFATIKLFASFINIIYNPFYKITSPSANRIRRCGFFYNNYLLIKSFFWNFNYFIKKIKHG